MVTVLWNQKVLGTAEFKGGEVVFTNVPRELVAEWRSQGLVAHGGKVVKPSDGEEFLKIMPEALSGAYLRAVVGGAESEATDEEIAAALQSGKSPKEVAEELALQMAGDDISFDDEDKV